MRAFHAALLLVTVSLASAGGVLAQTMPSPSTGTRPDSELEAPKHDGFWISFGLGGGAAFNDDFFGETRGGFASDLRLGGSPRQDVLVGGEFIGWTASEGDTDVSRANLMLSVLYYPSVQAGVYLRAGVGFAGRTAETTFSTGDLDITATRDEAGLGLAGGVGWDVRLGRNFYLTPAVDFLIQAAMDDQTTLLLFTVSATWH
jgi:hypothetical protein